MDDRERIGYHDHGSPTRIVTYPPKQQAQNKNSLPHIMNENQHRRFNGARN